MQTIWNILAPDEYGFHADVNPKADHLRWSQARKQRIGEGSRRETLAFNFHADQAASLYAGMDLRKNCQGQAGRSARLQAAVLTA